jgi:hypothetical protein
VGSVVMFGLPREFANYQLEGGECVLSCIPTEELYAHLAAMQRAGGVNLDLTLTVLAAAASLLLEGVTTLQSLVQAGRVQMEIHHASIGTDNSAQRAAVERIRTLSPHTMSWSNVVDYAGSPANFHNLARACSSKGEGEGSHKTTHYLYTMNWPAEVKGSSVLDFPSPSERKRILTQARDHMKTLSKEVGADDRWIMPLTDNPINICGEFLAHEYGKAWLEHFFRGQRFHRKETKLATYSPTNHTAALIFMELTYK